MVPEISNDEPSIIIYSGTQDEMNYDRGFFIGSKTLKPGKLRRDREGKYSFEEFEDLEPGQITELYVTADGDVIIAGKPGVAYSEVKFTNITNTDIEGNILPTWYGESSVYEASHNTRNNWCYDDVDEKYIIHAYSKYLDDNKIQSLINKGLLHIEFACIAKNDTWLKISFYNKDDHWIEEGASKFEPKSNQIEYHQHIPKGTNSIRVELNMYPYDHTNRGGWYFYSAPVLYLKQDYDHTPRWRE